MKNQSGISNQLSGQGWLQRVKRGVEAAGAAAGVLLAAPVKLPLKLLGVAKYLVLIAGLLKASTKPQSDE